MVDFVSKGQSIVYCRIPGAILSGATETSGPALKRWIVA